EGGQGRGAERGLTLRREWIDEHAASRGDAPYLEDAAGSGRLTYAGLARSVRAWARLLDEAGIPPGAGVAIRCPEQFGYAVALAGILGAGRGAVPLDPGAPAAGAARGVAGAKPLGGGGRAAARPPPDLPA